jgi:Ca-activated chloride channel homolog
MRMPIERFQNRHGDGFGPGAVFQSTTILFDTCWVRRENRLARILLGALVGLLPGMVAAQSSGGAGIGVGPVTSNPAQQDPVVVQTTIPPIKVDVKLVNVFVNVADANGAPVGGLTKDNFTLAEDGRPQKIAVFDRESAVPLQIVLAIDTSATVHKDSSIELHAAREFVHALLRPIDQLDLMEFASDVREVVPFTNSLHQIDNGLDRLRGGPATALYDTIFLASQSLAGRPGRKVLVLITDGDDTVKGVDYPRALEQALRSEVLVYSIIDVPIYADAGRDTGGEHALITLSQETGGKHYYADSNGLQKAFEQVSEDLRTQYLLGYYPSTHSSSKDFRTISVSLTGVAGAADYSFRHRTGYYPTK